MRSDGNTPFEEASINGSLYVRVVLADLHKDFGLRRRALRRLERQADRVARRVPGLSTLVHGGWVVVAKSEIRAIDNQVSQDPGLKRELKPGLAGRLRRAALKAFRTSASISDDGTSDGLHEYTLSLTIRPLLRTLFDSPAVKALTKGEGIGSLHRMILRSVPAGTTAKADLYAAHGSLEKIALDLTQFGHNVTPLWLDIKLSPGPRLIAPRHARALDAAALARAVLAISSTESSGGISSSLGGRLSTAINVAPRALHQDNAATNFRS